jgi:hypothetical protein
MIHFHPRKLVRSSCRASAVALLAAAGLATPALAQQTPPTPAVTPAPDAFAQERVVVTSIEVRGATRTHQDVTAEQAAGSSVQGRFAASPPGIGLMTGQGAATVN